MIGVMITFVRGEQHTRGAKADEGLTGLDHTRADA
jgi:hypothetical protein